MWGSPLWRQSRAALRAGCMHVWHELPPEGRAWIIATVEQEDEVNKQVELLGAGLFRVVPRANTPVPGRPGILSQAPWRTRYAAWTGAGVPHFRWGTLNPTCTREFSEWH